MKNDDLIGDIHFKDVHFTYPSRPGVKILDGISFDVKRGQTIALVGSSGSGKSTCVQLLQRFYDADEGSIFIDGHQVTAYNLKWLRNRIGVVSQEPILFQATIRENILLGRDSATDAEVHEAAKMANAHDFIMTLPDVSDMQRWIILFRHVLYCRNMRHQLVNEEQHCLVDKSNVLVR